MGLSLRMRRLRGNQKNIISVMNCSEPETEEEIAIPSQFQCPISYDLMKDPVIVASGITYDRESIEKWFESGYKTCPVTNTVLTTFEQIPNHAIRRMIQGWCETQTTSFGGGIERIPTPRVPVTSHQVSQICGKISSATRRGDHMVCLEIVGRIKRLGKESERNKKCMRENGVGLVLCVCFDAFAGSGNVTLLEDIVYVLTWMLPIGLEGQAKLASTVSLRSIVGLLVNGDDSVRQNAAFLLKELLSLEETNAEALAEIDGVEEAFVKLIRESVCLSLTKLSLTVIHHMVSHKPEIASKFLELGLVNLAVEMLVDSENIVCEKALLVIDAICETGEGLEQVRQNALVIPMLVKKILKMSESATRHSVSVMWKLCKTGEGEEVEEALRLGAFQKLVMTLQVGCGERTKAKISELLKMMNTQMKLKRYLVDSSTEFKHIKKPF